MHVTLDFNALFPRRMLKADLLTLVEAQSGQRVELQLAEDRDLRHASGNPALRLALGR